MSGRIFQNVVLQFKDTTDRTVGVIDAEGTVIACSELTGIGKKWDLFLERLDAAVIGGGEMGSATCSNFRDEPVTAFTLEIKKSAYLQ